MKKNVLKIGSFLMVLMFVFLVGCFNENKADKGVGVKLSRNGNQVQILSEGKYLGEEITVNKALAESDIVPADGVTFAIRKNGEKTTIAVVKIDSSINAGDALLTLSSANEVEAVLVDSVDNNKLEATKLVSRAGTSNVLLGDFNGDKVVSILDFPGFKDAYGKVTITTAEQKYDIAPAQKGTTAGWTDIYSISTPDSKVNIIDFVIFAKNFSKTEPAAVVSVVSIAVGGTTSVEKGKTTILTGTVTYSDNSTNTTGVVWTSADTNIATVDANGVVTGVKAGTVNITATKGSVSKSVPVTVTDIPVTVTSVTIAGSASVEVGKTVSLTATTTYSNSTTETTGATWLSSDTTVATIDSNGIVTALKAGTTNITAAKGGVTSAAKVVTVSAPFTSGIKLHVKGFTNIYAWTGTNTELFGAWPGKAMDKDVTDGWYTVTIPNVTTCNMKFNNSGSGDPKGDQKDIKTGEYWYEDGVFKTEDPINTVPEVTATPASGKYKEAQSVVLKSTQTTDKIYYTVDGSTPTASSTLYSNAITVPAPTVLMTIKAFGVNSKGTAGAVATFTYTVDPSIDDTAPVVTPSLKPGIYDTDQTITLTVTDDKDTAPKAYYTIDGNDPTTSSPLYTAQSIQGTVATKILNIKVLAIDKSGNQKTYTFSYYFGKITTTRFDPRQETIYFLLTARWFDGDKSNSIGDQNCSWTPTRGANAGNGFTGEDDVSWRGDFKGLVEKLDYIKALGFTAIWITPIVQNRSPLSYHGYHGWDFTKEDERLVSPGYGFDRVIQEAHARGIKICLDIVLNHSGPFGIKDFAELKYNYPSIVDGKPNSNPIPDEWSGWSYDESKYKAGQSQAFPGGWKYDGLHSPGTKGGTAISPSSGFASPDLRPFTDADKAQYPDLLTTSKYWYDSTMSYCSTIDGKASYSEPNSLTYAQYKESARRMRGHNTGFPTGSGSFDNFPDAHFDSLHNHCPDLNTENKDVQNYLLNAYYRYIDMGVDMFRVDTVMHIHKETLNTSFWPQLLARAEEKKAARGGSEFLIFGEVANFVSNPTDKATQLREQNYTWDQAHNDTESSNHLLNGNTYRTPDYSAKAPNGSAPGKVSVINMIAHNGFCNGEAGGYGAAVNNDRLYNDATYMPWYADSHDYGPNKGETRYKGDFKPLWSMLFTFRGIPVVYYGSEIRFQEGKPNDWPTPGSAAGTEMSLQKTGRGYYGPHLDGTVTATNFGEYTATGGVATTLSSDGSQHLIRLNKIRMAVPALQMGQYSTAGCSGGWAAFKRRYTGTNTITGEKIDSYAVVGVGAGTYSFTGILDGKYIDCVTGDVKQVSGGTLSFTVPGDASNLRVYVLDDLTTKAPGKVIGTPTKFIY